MKRNSVTTSATRQMQSAVPHRRWVSSASHVAWQRAVSDVGVNSPEAQIAYTFGIEKRIAPAPKPSKLSPRRLQQIAEKAISEVRAAQAEILGVMQHTRLERRVSA